MRYLGNKESIMPQIESLLVSKGLTDKGLIFFDAFCGTGTVAEWLKDRFNLINELPRSKLRGIIPPF